MAATATTATSSASRRSPSAPSARACTTTASCAASPTRPVRPAKAIVEYTWGKLYNAKAYNACSGMPRFGHVGMLSETQMKDLMALLLDPKSPVNQ
jgi:hypothetical protein